MANLYPEVANPIADFYVNVYRVRARAALYTWGALNTVEQAIRKDADGRMAESWAEIHREMHVPAEFIEGYESVEGMLQSLNAFDDDGLATVLEFLDSDAVDTLMKGGVH